VGIKPHARAPAPAYNLTVETPLTPRCSRNYLAKQDLLAKSEPPVFLAIFHD
jgi:hypothetical protein